MLSGEMAGRQATELTLTQLFGVSFNLKTSTMKKLKYKEFNYPQQLVDFVNENRIDQTQIAGVSIALGKQVLYYWEVSKIN